MHAFGGKRPILLGLKLPLRGSTNTAKHSVLLVQVRSRDTRQRKPLNHMREFLPTSMFHYFLSNLSCGSNSFRGSAKGRKEAVRQGDELCVCPQNLVTAQRPQLCTGQPAFSSCPGNTHLDPLDFITDSQLPPFCIPMLWLRRY